MRGVCNVFIYSVCSLASFKSLSQSKQHRFQHKGLTEEEDLAMPSDERQAVFQATKVRNHLKNDGSWINKSQDVQDTQSDVKARKPIKLVKPKNDSSPESSLASPSINPCAESAVTVSSSQDSSIPPQSSYVMSALRKFEPKENTPVRNGSNLAKSAHPDIEDSRRAHVEEAAKTSIVKPAEQPPADVPVKDIVKKPIVKPVEEPLKTHADTPKMNEVKKPVVKPVEEPLKTHEDAAKMNVAEKPIVKPVEEPLKTHADAPKKELVEKPEEKPVEEPLKTPTDVHVKNIVEKPVEESLKTHIEETGKTPVKTVKTLHETPAKPSGMLTTENKGENMVEQVTVAHAPIVEAPLAPRQAQNQPTCIQHGESSTKTTTEPTEEHHKLNSKIQLNNKDKTLCSFCKLPVDGNVKISINIPAICCHPDCFKCNDCSTPLGDLSSSMYHYAGKILCGNCFDQIFQL